jgi:hypothetical protein
MKPSASKSRCLALLSGLMLLAFMPAAAQEAGEPVILTPPAIAPAPGETTPTMDGVGEDGSLQAPGAYDPTAPRQGIAVDTLPAVGPDWTGILAEADGGFAPGMWRGTPRALVERLLPALPLPSTSPTVRDLARRLLLSEAEPPQGPAQANLPALRVERLAALGQSADVARLIGRFDDKMVDATLARQRLDAVWLQGDASAGCDLASALAERFAADPGLQRALVFCRARAGQGAEASLSLDMLREQGQNQDLLFEALAEALIHDAPVKIDAAQPVGPLHLAMLDALALPLPPAAIERAAPAVLAALAARQVEAPAVRLAAAERALRMGALPIETVQRLYAEETAAPGEIEAAETAPDDGPHARAILYQATTRALDPASRARLLAKALAEARRRDDYVATVSLYAALLMQVAPNDTLAWFTAEAGPALYLLGGYETASAWLDVAQRSSDPQAVLALPTLWLFAHVAGGAEPIMLDAMIMPEAGAGAGSSGRAARYLAILEAFGADGGGAVPSELLASATAEPTTLPDAGLWFGLDLAARQGRVGETVLLALVALGEGGPATTPPVLLGRVLSSLIAVGLADEARALAYEAAVADAT